MIVYILWNEDGNLVALTHSVDRAVEWVKEHNETEHVTLICSFNPTDDIELRCGEKWEGARYRLEERTILEER
jgi:hypothetical protein